jgi:ABC-type nitrate/sulfonate/bicarbonate transport system substrate-binding protein
MHVQLSWTHANEFSGFYTAIDKGYYADANLNVELTEGGYDAEGNFLDPVAAVAEGRADFGIIDSTVLLTAREQGKPLIAIMTIYQRHPLALTSLAENGIERPEDLVGKDVQISYTSSVVYQALLNAQGIDPESVNTIDRVDFTDEALLSGGADVIDAWVTNEVVSLTMKGEPINFILPSDYGIDVYPNVIFTTEALLNSQPEVVKTFVQATIKGMQYTADNPEEAVDLTLKYNETLNRESELEAMQRSLPLLNPANSKVGAMTDRVWQISYDILVEQGLLQPDFDLQSAYTLDLLTGE